MIYLDYQATTPLAPEVREAMLPWLDRFGNPHSPHRMGREAAAAVGIACDQVLAGFGSGRVTFTGSATEAANWVIKSSVSNGLRRRIVTIATEHDCVLESARWLETQGFELIIMPVGRDGIVSLEAAAAAIDERTALVAAMLVNNEIGVIQPIAELGALARAAGATMFCDAVQGYGRVPIPTDACDMVAISAHKIHGPKGIGALWTRDGVSLPPLIHGGGQQDGMRSGTLAPMLCVGFGEAARLAHARRDADRAHVDTLFERLRTRLSGWVFNGSIAQRYRGNANIRREGVDSSRLISELRGVALSAGSACASGSGKTSHVLSAIGLTQEQARASIRMGFGRYTTAAEIDEAAGLIAEAAERQLAWAA